MAQVLRLVVSLLCLHICAAPGVAASLTEAIDESLATQDYRLIVRGGRGGIARVLWSHYKQKREPDAECVIWKGSVM